MATTSPSRSYKRKGIHDTPNLRIEKVPEKRSQSSDEENVESAESDEDFDSSNIKETQKYKYTKVVETKRTISQSPSRGDIFAKTQHKKLEILENHTKIYARSGTGRYRFPFLPAGLLVALLLAIIGLPCYLTFNGQSKDENVRHYKSCNTFDSLKKTFPKQKSYLWKALKVGIEGVLNNAPPSPSVFLFLLQNNDSSRALISTIVKATAECFDPNLEAVTLNSNFFASVDVVEDHGIAIQRYRNDLKDGGVLLITDLNDIPADSARALHFICDNVNPIVPETVIFLTLIANSDVGNPVQVAEDTLKKLWGSTLDNNVFDPLITRITDQVIRLLPE